MASDGKEFTLMIEWCNVQQALAKAQDPATQVIKESYGSLKVAFSKMGDVHHDLFDPAKVNAIGLPAYVRSVGLYENDQLILRRSAASNHSESSKHIGPDLVIVAELLNKDMLNAISEVLNKIQIQQGYVIGKPPRKSKSRHSRKRATRPVKAARRPRRQ